MAEDFGGLGMFALEPAASLISTGQEAGRAIGIPFDLPVHATTSHQKTARTT